MIFRLWLESYIEKPQLETLRIISQRVPRFQQWLRDVYDEQDVDETDQEWILGELNQYLEEELDIIVREDGLIEVTRPDNQTLSVIGDLPIVVYHHTTDVLDEKIETEGIRSSSESGVQKVNSYLNTSAGVYVTLEAGTRTTGLYQDMAVRALGGNRRTWVIKTHLNNLIPDPDDEDLSVGYYQFILSYVSPSDLVEKF